MAQFPEDSLSILDYMRPGQAEINARRRQATMSDRIRNRYAPTFPEDPNAILQFLERTQGNGVSPEIAGLAARLKQATSGSAPVVDMNQRSRDAMDSMWKNRIEGADSESIYTPEEAAIDNHLTVSKRLSGRNQNALEGRLPNYKPQGLTVGEQGRVAARLQRSARGGQVDETSPLNGRAAAYAALDRREAAKKAEQDRLMSERFQALQATRAPDAVVESSKVLSDRRNVRTIAEKIAGVEDDPSTPMDESIRYRAEWQSPEGKEAMKAKGLANAAARRQARTERVGKQRDAVMSGRLAAMSGQDAPTLDDPVLARIAQQAYMRSSGRRTQADQGSGQYLTDEKAAQILQQARNQQLMTGGNEVAQALDYIKTERDRFAQRDALRSTQAHDLVKIDAQGKVSERLQDKELVGRKELQTSQNLFDASRDDKKMEHATSERVAGDKSKRELVELELADRNKGRLSDLEQATLDRQVENLQDERRVVAEAAANDPTGVAQVKAGKKIESISQRISNLVGLTETPAGADSANPATPVSDRLNAVKPVEIPPQSEAALNAILGGGGTPQEQADAIMDLVKGGLITEPQAIQGTGEDYSLTRDAVKARVSEKLRYAALGPRFKGNPAGYGFREWAEEHFGGNKEVSPEDLVPRQRFKETKKEFADRVALVNQYRQTLGLPPVTGIWQ